MKNFRLREQDFGYLRPYIIAEIGVNHEGSLERAKRMIAAAARAGSHAAKFQTYKADLIATRGSSPAYWDRTQEPASSQHALFQRWDTFEEKEYRALAEEARNCGVDFLSTPFDLSAVDLICELSPAIKIASADVTNVPLLRKIGSSGLPVIMSLGASRIDEAAAAVEELRQSGAISLTLLHCVLNYPTAPGNAQLAQIGEWARIFGDECAIGYSDHIRPDDGGGMAALDMAAILGAVVIEKHFTDDKAAPGNDHYHSMDEADLAAFNKRLAHFRELYGSEHRDLAIEAQAIKNARRRIVAADDLEPGQILDADKLIALRSNCGIEISHWDRVLGKTANKRIARGSPLKWTDLG